MKIESITTKFGTAKINNGGYWMITSAKEGNNGKRLHRLIFEDYHKCTLLPWAVIHHRDGNKLNNRYSNLELISRGEHNISHKLNIKHSDETKQKISENNARYWKGKSLSDETKQKMSESKNTSGYLNVSKRKNNRCKQGFTWCYRYYAENDKRKVISSVDIEKLEAKVKAKGLPWRKFEKED